jgi:arylformamidase
VVLSPDDIDGDLWEGNGWIDVSRPLCATTPVWPGDRPFELDQLRQDGLVVSSITSTCHIGTHLDAPLHLDPTGVGVEGVSVDRCVGPAEVVSVPADGRMLTADDLPMEWVPRTPRVLLRSESHPLGREIGSGFTALSAELVHRLADDGVIFLGVDTPSVDPFESEGLPAHRALLERGMTWIEGMWLANAEPGRYFLVALPMLLEGSEAAPVRAILKKLGS